MTLFPEYGEGSGKRQQPKGRGVNELAADDCVTNRRGIFEFLLGGSVDTKLLEVRVFDMPVKRAAYAKQTQAAERKGKSNCPHCAVGHGANKNKSYKFDEMDADHVAAWSKGGKSTAKNCEMLLHHPQSGQGQSIGRATGQPGTSLKLIVERGGL